MCYHALFIRCIHACFNLIPISLPSMIDVSKVQSRLKSRSFGRKIYAFESIDSTNTCARALASNEAPEGAVVVADFQTAGKGRLGRTWSATASENLLFSVILRPRIPPEGVNLLPLLTAVAVARAISERSGLKPDCKWPNDLLLRGKKFCGILLEGVLREGALDFVIAGIGVNVNQVLFPDELKDRATSLRIESGKEFDREELLRGVLAEFETLYSREKDDDFRSVPKLWMSHSGMIGKTVDCESEGATLSGVAEGVASDGALILLTDAGRRSVYAGDVTLQPRT
jgi:BirA family transcriptional regulator, biotin operon repressor / biotin---[acetyl-CoA-carboxylase] ligase